MSAGGLEDLHRHIVASVAIIDGLVREDPAAAVGAMQRCVNSLGELQRRLAAVVGSSEVWALDGFRSAAPWIAFHSGLSRRQASRLHRNAVTMRSLPHASAAALHGALHDQHVDAIAGCARRAPDRFDDDTDAAFTAVAASGDLDAFTTVVREWNAWVDAVDSPDPADLEPVAAREAVTLGETLDGWWQGQVLLSPQNGALLAAMLDRGIAGYLRAQRDGDPSVEPLPIPALRAQALMDLADRAARHDPCSTAGPDRFHLAVTLHADTDGHIAPVEPAMPAATCDASLFRLVVGAEGQPLDIGRRTRTWPTPIRVAVIRRDRHCRFPGCAAPPGQCDIHHCTPWEHGGGTSIGNAVLLCRWHHTFLHTAHWNVQLDAHQQPTFTKPDGTTHTLHSQRPGAP